MPNFNEENIPKWEFPNRRIRKSALKDGSKYDYDPSAKTKYYTKKQLSRLSGHVYRKINNLDRFGRDASKKYEESYVPKERFVNRRHRNASLDSNKAKADYHHGARFDREVNSDRYKKDVDKMFDSLRKDSKRSSDIKSFRLRQLSKADSARKAAGGLKKESIQMKKFCEFLNESKHDTNQKIDVKESYQAHQMSPTRFKKYINKNIPGVSNTDKKIFQANFKRDMVKKNAVDASYRTHKSNGKFDRKVGRAITRLGNKAGSLKKTISNLAARRPVTESRIGTRSRGKPKDLYWNRRQRTASIEDPRSSKSQYYRQQSKDRWIKRIKWSEPINVRESSPAWAKRLANAKQDYSNIRKDIDKAKKFTSRDDKILRKTTDSIKKNSYDKRKLKSWMNRRNKARPGLRLHTAPEGSAISRSVRFLRKKD